MQFGESKIKILVLKKRGGGGGFSPFAGTGGEHIEIYTRISTKRGKNGRAP